MKKNNPSVYIKTFGCQMNLRDSEFVAGILIDAGFAIANSMEEADIILFNSCSVRKHAEDRLISNIADLKPMKKKNPGLVIGLIGCTAQNYGQKMLEKLPVLDLVCGPGNEGDLPNLIDDILKNRCAIVATDKIGHKKPELFPGYRNDRFKAYVSIGEGCDNFCSYCIVPYVRGRERSRDLKDIVKEIELLAKQGTKEVTLLGQNVNSYMSGSKNGFVQLLKEISDINGIERIRFMTSHPKDASTALFEAMRDLDKVCGHLHLPLQAGSDRILKMMNRGYTRAHYLGLIEEYKKFVPDGSITTDIIVGFPSETNKDFKETFGVMKAVKFDSAYIFKYSPRPPAKSIELKDDVSTEEKQARLQELLAFQKEASFERNKKSVGSTTEILVDGECEDAGSMLTGRTRSNKVAVFKGSKDQIGKIVNIKIESATPYALKGRTA